MKNKKHLNSFLFFIYLLSLTGFQPVFSQNKEDGSMIEGWIIGLNTGFYFANNYSAMYYSGHESNENNISFVLDNQYRQQEILEYFDAQTYTWSESDLPQNMKYDPDINIGFLARNNLNDNWGIFFHFNYVKLVAKGNFILTFDPYQIVTEPNEAVFEIYGVEDRTNIDIGVHRQFNMLSPNLTYYGEIGININNTRVRESAIQLEDLKYSIVNRYGPGRTYVPGLAQTEYNFRLGGIGLGAFGSLGLKFIVNEQLTMDAGLTSYFKYVNLTDYKSLTVHWVPYVRIMYNGFFDFL